MAQMKPIVIDGCITQVEPHIRLAEVVSPEVRSIVTHDGQLIPRERFSQVLPPAHFTTNLSHIQKGGRVRSDPAALADGQRLSRTIAS